MCVVFNFLKISNLEQVPFVEMNASANFMRFFNSFFRFDHHDKNDGIIPVFELVLDYIFEQKGINIMVHNRIVGELFDNCYNRSHWCNKSEKLKALLVSSLDDEKCKQNINEIDLLALRFKEFNLSNQIVLLKLQRINSWIPNDAMKMSPNTEINVSPVLDEFCKSIYFV